MALKRTVKRKAEDDQSRLESISPTFSAQRSFVSHSKLHEMGLPFGGHRQASNENSLMQGPRRRAYTEIDDLLSDDVKDLETTKDSKLRKSASF